MMSSKKQGFNAKDFLELPPDEIDDMFNTGDYSLTITRESSTLEVRASRDLQIVDFIEVIVAVCTAAPSETKEDILEVVSHIIKVLNKKQFRILN